MKLCEQQSRLDVRKYSFLTRIVNPWNSLSDDAILSASAIIASFKAKLDNVWRNQPMKIGL